MPKVIKRDEVQPVLEPITYRLPPPGAGDPFFHLSRSWYYNAEKLGWLKLIRICSEGRQRGVTLVDFQQVAAFVRSKAAASKAQFDDAAREGAGVRTEAS